MIFDNDVEIFKILIGSQKLDKYLSIFGMIGSIVLLIYSLLIIKRGLYIVIPFFLLFSFSFWFFFRTQAEEKIPNIEGKYIPKILYILFFVTLTFLTLSFINRIEIYELPIIFYFYITLLLVIILLEILSKKINNIFILIQIILFSLVLIWSQKFLFPGLLGDDPWWHHFFTKLILADGNIPSGYNYSNMALVHLENAIVSLVTDTNLFFSDLISVNLIQIICSIFFIFLIGRFLFNDVIGLFSSLILVCGTHFIKFSLFSIPNSLSIVFILILIFMLIKSEIKFKLFIIIISISLLLVHPLASLFMLIILFTMYVLNNLCFIRFKEKIVNNINLFIALFFCISLFSWWTYSSGHIEKLIILINTGFNSENFISTPKEVLMFSYNISFFNQLFNQLGFFLFSSLSIIGILYMIKKKNGNSSRFLIAIVGFIPLLISFISILLGLFIIQERWFFFTQVLLSIPVVISMVIISNLFKKNIYKNIFIISLFLLLAIIMIISPSAIIYDSNSENVRYALKESEILSIEASKYLVNETIFTDHYYSSVIKHYRQYPTREISENLFYKNFNFSKGIILIREVIENGIFKLYQGPYNLEYSISEEFTKLHKMKIYDSNTVHGYIS